MKYSGFATTLILLAICIPVKAFSQALPDILNSIPPDYGFVSVTDVQRLVESPLYARAEQGQNIIGQVAEDLAYFVQNTGTHPALDISYLSVASKFGNPIQYGNLMIAIGRFNQKEIRNYLRIRGGSNEGKYNKIAIMALPGQRIGNTTAYMDLKIAFLSDQAIALGNSNSIQAFIDARTGAGSNIPSNPNLALLIRSAQANETYWFAGTSAVALGNAPVPLPTDSFIMIPAVTGSFNITDAVSGRISLTGANPDATDKLIKYYKKLQAVGPLLEEKDAGLKLLSGGLIPELNASQVLVSLYYSADTLAQLRYWSSRQVPANTKTSTKPFSFGKDIDNPTTLFAPKPPYTEEARKNKIQGSILVQLVVRKDGVPDDLKILRGLSHGLDESTINTILGKWRFIPGLLDGKPVDVQIMVEVSFKLF
jgi:TonB family protein